MRRIPVTAAALLALLACGTKHTSFTGKVLYGQNAEENYQAGLDELEGSNYPEATKFFEYVSTKYPFSKYSALAELRLADVKFRQGRFAEAAEAYRQFVQMHPTSEELDYAEFRAGLSRFREAPDDFALFPPVHEKDDRAVRAAAAELKDLVTSRPDSKYAPEAKKVLQEATDRLARHEWYVAEFYYKRKKWAGAARRLETLVERYPGSGRDVEALLRLADAYVEMDERHKARKALQQVVVKFPDDPRRPEAEKRLAGLR
jgi:outer membrane protein assembly factor BamD